LTSSLQGKLDLKILLIQFKPAGDVLLLTSVVKALKKKFPLSSISFIINEKESILITQFKLIDDLILIKNYQKNGTANFFKYLRYNLMLIRLVRKRRFDVVIDFIGNPKSAIMTFFSCAIMKIGRNLRVRSLAYNIKIPKHPENSNTVFRRLSHLKPLGIDQQHISPELHLSEEDIAFANDYINTLHIARDKKIIFLAPNSPRSSRRWKKENFISIGKRLIEIYNASILLAWGPGEKEYTESIRDGIGKNSAMIPPTSLTQMAAIISKAILIITNDSGTKHIANAVGVRSVTIYGPTNPYVWNEIDMTRNPAIRADVSCIQCEKRECQLKKHICMELVTPDKVMLVINGILGTKQQQDKQPCL